MGILEWDLGVCWILIYVRWSESDGDRFAHSFNKSKILWLQRRTFGDYLGFRPREVQVPIPKGVVPKCLGTRKELKTKFQARLDWDLTYHMVILFKNKTHPE